MTQWGKVNSLDFYLQNRSDKKDLYKSESALLKKIKKKSLKNILDIGCATGGFYKIFKQLFGNHNYFGLDIESKMIKLARKRFNSDKKSKFLVSRGPKLKFKNSSFDLVFTTGVLNHNKNYKKIISEMVRVSKKYTFIDSPRVHFGLDFKAELDLTKRFPSEIKKKNVVSNYTVNIKNYLIFLKKTFIQNKITDVTFSFDCLPYKKRYLKTSKKIYFLTMLCVKNKNKRNIDFSLLTKETKVKKIFSEVFNKTI